jgi:hypothetical protein
MKITKQVGHRARLKTRERVWKRSSYDSCNSISLNLSKLKVGNKEANLKIV